MGTAWRKVASQVSPLSISKLESKGQIVNAEQFLSDPLHYFIGLVGEPGSGKTKQAISFPRNYFVEVGDTYGLKTILEDPKNAALRKNLVEHVAFDIEKKAEAKDLFRITDKPEMDSIFGVLAHVKAMAKDKAIDTLTLDGGSFLFDYKGTEIGKGTGTTESDRWGYYRQLKNDLTWFVNANVMPLVSRHNISVILCLHVQREGEDAKAKQTSQNMDWSPRIEGSFRQNVSALPRAMIYLHQKVEQRGDQQVTKYMAYCQRVKVPHVGLIPAKNAYGLPPVLDLTDKLLYDELLKSTGRQAKAAK